MTPLDTLRRKDPGLVVIRQAARVTLVACTGFYLTRYVFDDAVMAVYALFGAVALGALSRLPPPPRRQSRICLGALPAAWALVTAGTVLAGNTWAAAAGMAVVGFVVSFAGVAGPALRGTANGLQLFYILPCFPPYALDTLGSRLTGVTIGVLGLAVAQRFLWPDPVPTRYEERLARAATALAAWLGRLPAPDRNPAPDSNHHPAAAPDRHGHATGQAPADPEPGAAPKTPADRDAEAAAEALAALNALRPIHLPHLERPASPSAHDRALSQAAMALRRLGTHLEDLSGARPVAPAAAGQALLAEVARTLDRTADALTAGVVPADAPLLAHGLKALAEERAGALRTDPGDWARRAPWDVLARQAALNGQIFVTASRVAAEGRAAVSRVAPPFRYARQSAAALWMRRFHAHLTRRSVYWQGAVRTALALAAARLVVAPLALTHGFWVLLATLTLMRGTAADTRTSLRQALIGTLCGAASAAVVLTAVADHQVVYRLLLPPLMFFAFCASLIGPAAVQGLFTLVVSMAFAQLSPVNWTLAEVRFVDVLVGGVVGALIGTVAWPRGSSGELCRLAAEFMDRAGAAVRAAVDMVSGPPGDPVSVTAARTANAAARQTMGLAQAAYEMYASERTDPALPHVDWQALFGTGWEMVLGAESLTVHYPPGALDAGPGVRGHLTGVARRVEQEGEALAARLGSGRPVRWCGADADGAVPEVPAVNPGMDSRAVLGATNTAVWLHLVTKDLAGLGPGRPDAVPTPGRSGAP
ncbi:FUSC family protein [Streptomyces sp. bgisy100]|uniref:FUSC family protein n=1 Tax=Streptomyces sp. bgisy100 TaxID=3413783 RepID=UPI003D717ED3